MNEYDSDKLSSVLEKNLKMIKVNTEDDADILLLNTCSIREKAQEKVFHQLGRWAKIKIKKPELLIAVGGCVASQEGRQIRSRSPQVDIIFGPQTIHRLPKMIREIYLNKKKVSVDVSFPQIEKFDFLPKSNKKSPSAYLSIMEGCSKYCTFCVVPYTRGEEVNRRFDDILYEADSLAAYGAREIILLGQNVNAYKSHNHNKEAVGLSDLIKHISFMPGIGRIRYMTSHPIDFSDDLVNEYYNVKLANNLHLPIQSGSDKILSMMKRKHTVLEYKNIVRKVRKIRPDINLTSDFIIGYPGETNTDFQETLDFIEELDFSEAYSFIYSPRPGTPASQKKDDIKYDLKLQRLAELKEVVDYQAKQYLHKMIGKRERILVEGISTKRTSELCGRTDNNKVVNFLGDKELIGKFVNIHIDEIRSNTLHGTYINITSDDGIILERAL